MILVKTNSLSVTEGEKHSKDKLASNTASPTSTTVPTPVNKVRRTSQKSPREKSESREKNYNPALLPSSTPNGSAPLARQVSNKGSGNPSSAPNINGSPKKGKQIKHDRESSGTHDDFTKFIKAVQEGNTVLVGELLKVPHFDIDVPSEIKGRAALHLACVDGNKQMVKLLLRHKASMNVVDTALWSPLHCAAVYGHFDVVVTLVEKGHDTNVRNVDDNTVLHYLVRNKMTPPLLRALEVLVKAGASVDLTNKNFETPLHTTINHAGDIEVCKFLIRNRASLSIKNKFGHTPIELANNKGRKEICDLLLAAYRGEDIDLKTNKATSTVPSTLTSTNPTDGSPLHGSANGNLSSIKVAQDLHDRIVKSSSTGNDHEGDQPEAPNEFLDYINISDGSNPSGAQAQMSENVNVLNPTGDK